MPVDEATGKRISVKTGKAYGRPSDNFIMGGKLLIWLEIKKDNSNSNYGAFRC